MSTKHLNTSGGSKGLWVMCCACESDRASHLASRMSMSQLMTPGHQLSSWFLVDLLWCVQRHVPVLVEAMGMSYFNHDYAYILTHPTILHLFCSGNTLWLHAKLEALGMGYFRIIIRARSQLCCTPDNIQHTHPTILHLYFHFHLCSVGAQPY